MNRSTRLNALVQFSLIFISAAILVQSVNGQTVLVSVGTAGTAADRGAANAWISDDGRYVAFQSSSADLIKNVDNSRSSLPGWADIFVRDLVSGTTRLVSAKAGTTNQTGNGPSQIEYFTPDGRYLLLSSLATDLVAGIDDQNNNTGRSLCPTDVFLFELQSNSIRLLSKSCDGPDTADSESTAVGMSDDGRVAVLQSNATDLVPGLASAPRYNRVYVYDVAAANMRQIELSPPGYVLGPGTEPSGVRVSPNGRFLMFRVRSGIEESAELFRHDLVSGDTTVVRLPGGDPVLSVSGRYAAVWVDADVAANDRNGQEDIYRVDVAVVPPALELVSVDTAGQAASKGEVGSQISISDDGRYVAFTYWGTGLVDGDLQEQRNIYLRDMILDKTILVSRDASGQGGANCDCYQPHISRWGETVAFKSCATNLTGAGAGAPDKDQVFIWQMGTNQIRLLSASLGGQPSLGSSAQAFVTSDGRYAVFESDASNLTATRDENGVTDIFVTTLASGPLVRSSGVVNGASFTSGVAAGSWFSIFGTNLASSTRMWWQGDFDGVKCPLSLDGTRVEVNGAPVPVAFISPNQINALAPLSPPGPASIRVVSPDGESNTVTVPLVQYAPAFFVFDPEDRRYAAAVHANGGIAGKAGLFGSALTTRPVKPHDVVMLWGTGFGPTTPAVPANELLTVPLLLSPGAGLRMTLGGTPIAVQWAGISGVGLYQFNVVIPDLQEGDHLLTAEAGGVKTDSTVFLTVGR